MRIDYERKLTKQELTNLTTKLSQHFTPASALEIFEHKIGRASCRERV